MQIKIGTINVNYIQYGSGRDIVLLHGWGQNIEMMKPLGDRLSNKFRITILDLPGFGNTPSPSEAWDIYKYEELLEEFLNKLKIKNPIMMGHSFGGRIAIIYASKQKTDKLVLFGSPCIREQVKQPLKVRILKTLKKIPGMASLAEVAKNYIGSRDYKNASPVMRDILVKVVNEDLSSCAKQIEAPTLLIWGDLDEEAPLEDAEKLEKIMIDAGLIVLEGCTHYAYLEQLNRVISILNNFL